ncbi:MAG: FAD-dependent thymidylate synthase [bacterium]
MEVKLLRHTSEPEKTVASAARLCYSPVSFEQLFKKMSGVQVKNLLTLLIKSGHHSALEHTSFTFAIGGISRVTSHQLVRHRLASYSQQSQRYVRFKSRGTKTVHSSDRLFDITTPFPPSSYVIPPSIEKNKKLRDVYKEVMDLIATTYQRFLHAKIPVEDVRYLLPNATATKIIVTMNARELRHFFSLRCCNRAQWEIRRMAYKMLSEVLKVAPILFSDAGPPCWRGPCPEGKMSCGNPPKREEVLEM